MILIVGIMEDKLLIDLGKRIRKIRLQKQMTQKQLAEKCGCNRNYISMLERGERNPSYKSLVMIATGLEMELHELIKG